MVSRVFARLGRSLVIVALVLTTGVQWAALQTVAWTTMLADNVCHESLSTAVNQTLDGKHPCCLCKAIAAGEKSEKKSETISPVLKMEFPPQAGAANLFPPSQFKLLPITDTMSEPIFSRPPPPPPRDLLA